MPWLALPFGDKRKNFLSRKFKVHGIPTLVALDPAGRTITTAARGLVMKHGANAFPFTEAHIKKLIEGPVAVNSSSEKRRKRKKRKRKAKKTSTKKKKAMFVTGTSAVKHSGGD